MEISKLNDIFNLIDTTDAYITTGDISRDAEGTLNIHFNVNRVDGTYLGDCSYSKYSSSITAYFSISCSDSDRLEHLSYSTTLVENVLKHFESGN